MKELDVIRTIAETGSTNADMLARAADGAPEGEWLRAERQISGKGRQGRVWESPVGNLYASTIVRLRPTDLPAPTLALVSAVALQGVVENLLPGRALLKWPNDLLIDGAKLSGMLLERAGDAVVIGIGVNIAHHPDLPDRLTTSLSAHGVVITPDAFLVQLSEQLSHWIARWRAEGLDPIRTRWLARAHPNGTPLIARLPDGEEVHGLFHDLRIDGALILSLADGAQRVIHAGDVFLI